MLAKGGVKSKSIEERIFESRGVKIMTLCQQDTSDLINGGNQLAEFGGSSDNQNVSLDSELKICPGISVEESNNVSEGISRFIDIYHNSIGVLTDENQMEDSSLQSEILKHDVNVGASLNSESDRDIFEDFEVSSSDEYICGTSEQDSTSEYKTSGEEDHSSNKNRKQTNKRKKEAMKRKFVKKNARNGHSDNLAQNCHDSISNENITDNNSVEVVNGEGQVLTDKIFTQKPKSRGGRQKKEKKTRKRVINEKEWKQNIRKKAKDEGKEYLSVTGKMKQAKVLQPACTCRKKCYEKIGEDDRNYLFKLFYSLPAESQNQYLSSSVEEVEKRTQRVRSDKAESRRQFSRKYFLKINGVDEKIEVCQTMFINTFDITIMKIRVIVEKKRKSGTDMCPRDGRGKHGKQIQISPEAKQIIINHINSFEAYESHYCRKRCQKKFLRSDLSVSQMYRLYKTYCKEQDLMIENESAYRKIFTEEFNLSFHKPSNDTCDKCDKFKQLLDICDNEDEKSRILKDRDAHLKLAERSYQEKSKDKEKSFKDPQCAFITLDLEKCLQTPLLRNNVSFYKRSLWTFNLTFYSIINKNTVASCYIWDETIAQRGSIEIASCIRQHLSGLSDLTTEVNVFSDSCCGQNRNINVAVMFLNFLHSEITAKPNLKVINQKFLQPGHTHMEADSLHAAIEKHKEKTNLKIEVPRDWANLIRCVRRPTPMNVLEMQQCNFLNFKSLLTTQFVHRKKNTVEEKVPWLKIKWLQFRKGEESKVFYKLSFEEYEEFKVLDLTRKRSSRIMNNNNNVEVPQMYSGPLSLPAKKVEDLHSLLQYIHPSSRCFYESLGVASEGVNTLAEVDSSEEQSS